jgi:hypothetical protein
VNIFAVIMAGFEVAGLVLASFSLLIAALGHYAESINKIRSFWRDKDEVASLMVQLRTENTVLANSLEMLFIGVMKVEHVAGYFSDPGGSNWRMAGDFVQQRLGGVYDVYLENVKGMAVSLERIKERLALDRSGKVSKEVGHSDT